MTLRGKRKIFDSDPQAQINSIAMAFGGKVPVKPLPRRYPGAAWREGNTFHLAKLTRKRFYHSISKKLPPAIDIFPDALAACGYLAQTYYRKVSLPDVEAARAGPVQVPTLAEAQRAIICWVQDWRQTRQSAQPIWQYCAVRPEGIQCGTTRGKPELMAGYPGPLITTYGASGCIDLLRKAFQLDIQGNELTEAFGKVVKVPKVLAVQEPPMTPNSTPKDSIGS